MGIEIRGTVQPGASLPEYGSAESAGADLKAWLSSPVTIDPGSRALIPTGMRIQIPRGYEGQIRPRSGLAVRNGVTVLNAPGTIDADYRGEVKVALINHGEAPFTIQNGDRIAQLILAPVVRAEFSAVKSLDATGRGEGGFGSTGV